MKHAFVYAAVFMFIVSACASAQTRFYRLSPVESACIACDAKAPSPTVSIGPVTIPDRLDRSQLVTLTGSNEVVIAEFDRWAGSLNDEITRTLTRDMSSLLPYMNIVPYDMEKWVSPDFRIRIDILQFDTIPGKNVHLMATYSITDGSRKTLLLKSADIFESTGLTYPEMVQAQSRILGALSRQIATSFIGVSK